MFNDLRDDQYIIVYVEGWVIYNGRIGDMPEDVRYHVEFGDLYLLADVENADIIAVH